MSDNSMSFVKGPKNTLYMRYSSYSHGNAFMHKLFGAFSKKLQCVVLPYTSTVCAHIVNEYYAGCKILTNPPELKSEILCLARPAIALFPAKYPAIPPAKVAAYSQTVIAESSELMDVVHENYCKPSSRLWKHQISTFLHLSKMRHSVLDMGMGTGKTFLGMCMAYSGSHEIGLIVAPKDIIEVDNVWQGNHAKHFKTEINFVTKGRRSIKEFVNYAGQQLAISKIKKIPCCFIINYEAACQRELPDFLLSQRFGYTIFDEVHRIKGNGPTSKFAAKLFGCSERIIALSGTLLPHSPLDAFGTFRAIDPSTFGSNLSIFKATYAVMGGPDKKFVVGFQNTPDMHERIASLSYRVDSSVLDLPEAVEIEKLFELSKETRKLYDAMEEEMCIEVEQGLLTAANAMVKVLKLQQIACGSIRDADKNIVRVGRDKVDALLEFLADVDMKEPMIIFCRFNADIDFIKDEIAASGRSVGVITRKQNDLIDWKDGKFDVLVAQIQKFKEGADGTRACLAIYYSIGHRVSDLDQSKKRIHRPGQKRKCRYVYLVGKNTYEENIYTKIDRNRDIVTSVLDRVKCGRRPVS